MGMSDDSGLVYFLHIPKTSGSSVHRSLMEACEPPSILPHLIWDDVIIGGQDLSGPTRLISGHFAGFLPLWIREWPRIVTMVREPMARALSHINEIQRHPGHPLHELAEGLSVEEYCEHPELRKTVDNFQARYLASLDFAMTLMPRPSEGREHEPYASLSVRFESALYSLDRATGLLDAAVRALDAIDAVGICEAHAASLKVFARVLGWDVEIPEYRLNRSHGQRTLAELSRRDREALASLNEVDSQVYAHAIGRFVGHCRKHGIELDAGERSAFGARAIAEDGCRVRCPAEEVAPGGL